jgi:hypothetical protein
MSYHSNDGSLFTLIFTIVFVAILMLGWRGCEAIQCDEVGDATGKPTQFRFISGCYVKVDGRWVPRDSWRGEQE